MDLRKLISDKEEAMIEYYLINHTESGLSTSIDYILREWNDKKREYLFKMLGGNLILEKDIEFYEDKDQMVSNFENRLFDEDNKKASYFYDVICNSLINLRVYDRDFSLYNNIVNLLSLQSIIGEVWEGPTFEIPMNNFIVGAKSIKIQRGTKIMRVIRKIAEVLNVEGYEEFRILHSMALNQKKLKGKLCLSIHPLDYMTMSDNSSDWSSCMSWKQSGCYRQGTVEMMNSPMVVVAYLKSENAYTPIGRNNWNSKKWRQLFIVTEDIISNVKAYPYANANLTDVVLTWIKELVNQNLGNDNYTDNVFQYNHEGDSTCEELGKVFTIYMETGYMYNDFSDNQRCFIRKNIIGNTLDIYYSGKSECMTCGELDIELDSEERLSCDECYSPTYCYSCGDRYEENEMYEIDGELYCSYCRDEYGRDDNFTGEFHAENNMARIYVADGNKVYNKYALSYELENDYTEAKNILRFYMNKIKRVQVSRWEKRFIVDISDLTEDGIKAFECCDLEDLKEELNCYHSYTTFNEFNLEESVTMYDFVSWSENNKYYVLNPAA